MPKIGGLIQALQRIPVAVYVVAGAITVYGGWLALDRAKQREIGALNAQIAQAEQTNADLRHVADSLAKVYRTDTVRLTRLKLKTDTLTATVDQWKHDTLKVVEYVHQADTTLKTCMEIKHTCEARLKVAEDGWANARSEIAKVKSLPKPGWIARHTAASVGVGATYGQDGKVAVGPTISFGFRFFP